MKLALAAVLVLGVSAAVFAAHAEGEGGGDPFPFRAPPITILRPSTLPDTGTMALPNFSSRPGQRVAAGDGVLPSNGSEGAVQSAASLPRAFGDTPAILQAQAAGHGYAMAQFRMGPG